MINLKFLMMKILWMYGRMIDLVCPYVHKILITDDLVCPYVHKILITDDLVRPYIHKILITDDLVRVCPYYVHKTVIVQVSPTSTYIWNYSVGKKEWEVRCY